MEQTEDLTGTYDSRITQLEDEIQSQVSRTEFDDLGNTVSQHTTQIEQNKDQVTIQAVEEAFGKEIDSAIFDLDAGGIETRVTSAEQEIGTIQGDIDTLDGRLGTAETDITDLSAALDEATGGSNQSIDDLYTLYSTVSTQTSQNESRWQAEADRIDAMVGPNDEALDEWDPSSSEHDSFIQAFETEVKTEATEASITAAKSAAIDLGAEQAVALVNDPDGTLPTDTEGELPTDAVPVRDDRAFEGLGVRGLFFGREVLEDRVGQVRRPGSRHSHLRWLSFGAGDAHEAVPHARLSQGP